MILIGAAAQPATGLVSFDFEQQYFVHPERMVWDFCVIRPDSVYHLYYHSILEATPGATKADTIWHATSLDLAHWNIQGPVLTVGPDWWDGEAMWAPDVVRDDSAGRWTMVYTGVDSLKVQRACLAHSLDLSSWVKDPASPVFAPDSLIYFWNPTLEWSAFRDPFLYHADGTWNILSTAALRLGDYPGYRRGIVHRSTSNDLISWTDQGVFFENNGDTRWHDLESSQYHERGGWHHLFCSEYDVPGTSHLVSDSPAGWDMADRQIFDAGWAPEIDQFDPGIDIFSRLGKGQHPLDGSWFIVVRFDTLQFGDGGATPQLQVPHPLDRDWAVREGSATLGNPTFGDNPAERGDDPCGVVGHGWFGSQEYYQGPLSGRGSPGTRLGDSATGTLTSFPFTVTGDSIRLLVGGGYYPETCYVALLDAVADTVLVKETGQGNEFMTPRRWDVRAYKGMLAAISIVDAEMGPFGHLNVDEIVEYHSSPVATTSAMPAPLLGHRVQPNPCNPATVFQLDLAAPARIRVLINDLRGRLIWESRASTHSAGPVTLGWQGHDQRGRIAPAGVYLYWLEIEGRIIGGGKLTVVK